MPNRSLSTDPALSDSCRTGCPKLTHQLNTRIGLYIIAHINFYYI